MTVLEILQRSTEYLAARGVDSARLNAELLLSHVLQKPRLRLYLEFDRNVTEADTARARELVRRRGHREPLQHLTGTAAFLGHELEVSPAVLIPRPETEVLAQAAIRLLSGREEPSPLRVLDFGTGSGCLAIAIAAAVPFAEVHALDLSTAALDTATRNARRSGVDRIRFHLGDGFAALQSASGLLPGDLDLLVSNPPYIPTGDLASLDPEVRDHDPRAALDGGADGLHFYRRLSREAPAWLKPGAPLLLEFGDGQAPALQSLFQDGGWRLEAVEKDLSGTDRILIVRSPTA
ncbi:MAG: peptide chain release factor N(5)-glutamine methyltransferase [Verrucomicrobia bacterium]|nr:peptide chain release factor N(5)-glutamine methyltransferase [Verrucomicrobiota bacterium]